MKNILLKLITGAVCTSMLPQCESPAESKDRSTNQPRTGLASLELSELFARPLIIGVSVSANYGTESPGRRAALRYTNQGNIRTVARGGTPGVEIYRMLKDEDWSNRTLVIAMDLFFWDSVLLNSTQSEDSLEGLIARTTRSGTTLVLGNIPELLPGRQPARSRLNERITELCRKENRCYVWDLDSLHRQVLRDGFLNTGERRLTLSQIVPDGLHLSNEAGNFWPTTLKHF